MNTTPLTSEAEHLLQEWKITLERLGQTKLDDQFHLLDAGRHAMLKKCIQDLEELTAPRA